jgi:Spy/CpxP family protein refolding chaperone
MIGLALGLGAIGFFIAHRARRRAFAGGCGRHGHHGWHGGGWHGRWHGRDGGWLGFLSGRLDTTPAQERVIQREVRGVVERARDARRGAFDGKAELARAIGGTTFDATAAQAGFAGLSNATKELETAAIEALRKIHEVLDDEQRKELARLIEGGGWRFGGPYR